MDDILNYNRDSNDDFYSILGCEESSTEEQIITEFKVRALDLHPDKNPDDPSTVEKFQKLQRAKEILTCTEKRKLYDTWRRSGLAMPFDQWQNLSKGCHTSMHWACKKQKDLMLKTMSETGNSQSIEEELYDEKANPASSVSEELIWRRDPGNEALQKFRSYQI